MHPRAVEEKSGRQGGRGGYQYTGNGGGSFLKPLQLRPCNTGYRRYPVI